MIVLQLLFCNDFLLLSQVNINNLETYVSLIVKATVGAGIAQQVKAFKSGFNEVCSMMLKGPLYLILCILCTSVIHEI